MSIVAVADIFVPIPLFPLVSINSRNLQIAGDIAVPIADFASEPPVAIALLPPTSFL